MTLIKGNEQQVVDEWKMRFNHYRKFLDIVAVIAANCPKLPLPEVRVDDLKWNPDHFVGVAPCRSGRVIAWIMMDGLPNNTSVTTTHIRFAVLDVNGHHAYYASISDPTDLPTTASYFQAELLREAEKRGYKP